MLFYGSIADLKFEFRNEFYDYMYIHVGTYPKERKVQYFKILISRTAVVKPYMRCMFLVTFGIKEQSQCMRKLFEPIASGGPYLPIR